MLSELQINNYKCFLNHTVRFAKLSIVVGRNNAGKSTLVEALRLVALVTKRLPHLRYERIHKETINAPVGVKPSLKGIDIELTNAFYNYGNPPAIITAQFCSGVAVEIYVLADSEIVGIVRKPDGSSFLSYSSKLYTEIPQVRILPQVAPVSYHERILDREYVRRNIDGRLSPQHFRNQLHVYYEYFDEFRQNVEETWPGMQIVGLEANTGENSNELSLYVRDGAFTAEIAWMGHGLQMWLQTIWFMTRAKDAGVVVLDEPDVYLHADLQRKLLRLIRGRWPQVIIATHSVEIISETEPIDIVVLDRNRDSSVLAKSLRRVQFALEKIGSLQNIHLARLSYAGRCLFVEGKDLSLLRLLTPVRESPEGSIESLPNLSVGGWGGWRDALAAAKAIRAFSGGKVKIVCLFDSDYHLEQEIETRLDEAKKFKVLLHVWKRKEIENYFLVSTAISRAVNELLGTGSVPDMEIESLIQKASEECKMTVTTGYMDSLASTNRRWTPSRILKEANKMVEHIWSNQLTIRERIPGKSVISKVLSQCQTKFGVSLSIRRIIRNLLPEEIDKEIIRFVETALGRPVNPADC